MLIRLLAYDLCVYRAGRPEIATAMSERKEDFAPVSGGVRSIKPRSPYSTFPHVTTHGPADKRCFHGKPEDWKRMAVKRTFGSRVK